MSTELPRTRENEQINVPPKHRRTLWKVIVPEIKCPRCSSAHTTAITGKRINSEGLKEHYRLCRCCDLRFRVVFE